MTESKRITLNVIATYGRTILSIAVGLFTCRWLLQALGPTDYGLHGLVGGLMVFVSIINALFCGAVGRFYAIAIGQMRIPGEEELGLHECHSWFTCAVILHIALPTALVIVGYPIGAYAVQNGWLNIPSDRVYACLWVWRCSCITTYFGMMTSPIVAMFGARQNIAELTIYSVVQTIVRFFFIFYMTLVPRDWLIPYSIALMFISLLPNFGCTAQAFFKFKECRFVRSAVFEFSRYRQLVSFAGWQGLAAIGYLARSQGMAIIINRHFGAQINAAVAIGTQLSAHSTSLASSLKEAFQPAIITACGAREYERMRTLSYRVSKLSLLMMLIFAVPLALEVNEVLVLWLKTPPVCSAGICLCMLAIAVLEKASLGQVIAICAMGRIALTEFMRGFITVLFIPVACLALFVWPSVYVVALSLVGIVAVTSIVDVYLARSRTGMSIRVWLKSVIVPVTFVTLVGFALGGISIALLPPSFWRICLTTALSLIGIGGASWRWCLNQDEKAFLVAKFGGIFRRFKR